MKDGIYGLASLDGSPVDRTDRDMLFAGLDGAPLSAKGCVMAARDANPAAIDARRTDDRIDLFLGDLDAPRDDAGRLGLDQATDGATLAVAARARWGVDAATKLAGEWLLAQWDGVARTLTLAISECARDDCYYAVRGGRVAFAPQLTRLARLPWVDGSFDADVVMRSMAGPALHEPIGGRSILRGVSRLRPGQSVVIASSGAIVSDAVLPPPPPLAAIRFEAAMEEVEQLLRSLMRRRMAGRADVAFLLSGGLDSSLLAWIGAQERQDGQRIHFLSSAAPEGSGIVDETDWAECVTQHLGEPLLRVAPHPSADIYAPTARWFAKSETPAPSPRHYLYEAFEDAAYARGARLIVDGCYGEMTISNHARFLESWARRARHMTRAALDRFGHAVGGKAGDPDDPFHVEPAWAARAAMTTAARGGNVAVRRRGLAGPLGFEPGWTKTVRNTTGSGISGLRYVLPFRDRRLLRLAASFPASFAVQDGAPRAMVRSLLRGRVPDRIACRTSKMAFSPTYDIMLRDHAERARARIPSQRQAGADEWVDLAWLDQMLARASAGARLSLRQKFRMQGTATAAEFFRWWADRDLSL